jgi:hypothetical protein
VLGRDLMGKIRSKSDIYWILSCEHQLHLPNFDDCSLEFLREVLSGRKKLFRLKDVSIAVVPRYEEFNCDLLYRQALEDENAKRYLPDPSGNRRRPVNRKFLFNVRRAYLSHT